MAILYVRSTTGSNANNGTTWALAKATIAGALAIATAGDTVYVSQVHAETTSGAVSLTSAGTLASPILVICGNDGAAPPTALATTATLTQTTSGAGITFTGQTYYYGIAFITTLTTGVILVAPQDTKITFDNCSLQLNGSNTSQKITFGSTATGGEYTAELLNTSMNFTNAGQTVNLLHTNFRWTGGSVTVGTAPTTIFTPGADTVAAMVENVNFSACTASTTLIAGSNAAGDFCIRNCLLPTSWLTAVGGSGVLGTPTSPACKYRLHNSDDDSYVMTNFFIETDCFGTVYMNPTYTRRVGNTAWQMTTSANAKYPGNVLRSPEIVRYVKSQNNAYIYSFNIIATISIIHDGATAVNNDDIWIEATYMSATKGTAITTRRSLTAAATSIPIENRSSLQGFQNWNGIFGTGPNGSTVFNQLIITTASFTPYKEGFVSCRVCMAKPSYTIFVEPLLNIAYA